MKFETIEVTGFKPAIMTMRNPLKSYAKSDTDFEQPDGANFAIGEEDYKLAMRLWSGGSVHRKWMRQVFVWVNITAPLYWYSEFDTYSQVTKNSESTMHTLYKDIDAENNAANNGHPLVDLAYERVFPVLYELQGEYARAETVAEKNFIRQAMKQILPCGYEQKRGVCLNYEVLANMYEQRKNHKLPEWSVDFVNWVHTLPYSEFITGEKEVVDTVA